jgi:hypothetical protein
VFLEKLMTSIHTQSTGRFAAQVAGRRVQSNKTAEKDAQITNQGAGLIRRFDVLEEGRGHKKERGRAGEIRDLERKGACMDQRRGHYDDSYISL